MKMSLGGKEELMRLRDLYDAHSGVVDEGSGTENLG